jgi:NitT/TauT family transport system permease protein
VTARGAGRELRSTELELAAALEAAAPRGLRSRVGGPFRFVLVGVAVLLAWELAKLLGGDPIRVDGQVAWNPPFRVPLFSDLSLPHVWTIGLAFFEPVQGTGQNLLVVLLGNALFTARGAGLGFAFGAMLGLFLATVFVHSRFMERALVPYVIASQTVPIIALAPMIVLAVGPTVAAVVIIATYLTFFPVTIAMIRGLRSPDPRALELMRSYAASPQAILWKVRLPASLPYLFTALKIAATASIVGAIVGEGPGQMPDGLGRAIITFNQYYITAPERLWAAIIVSGALGIVFFMLVRAVERRVLRDRPDAGAD